MASTCELCATITKLGGDPEALSDKLTKTLEDEIIRILSCGSCLHLNADAISYEQTTVGGKLDSLCPTVSSLRTRLIKQERRVPTASEVLSAIQAMTPDQIALVNNALSGKTK